MRKPLTWGAILALALGMVYYRAILLRSLQRQFHSSHGFSSGNWSDLYSQWLGSRELLLRSRNPYSADVTRDTQIGLYGRPLDPSRPDEPHNEAGFVFPVYVAFLLAPTVKSPFVVVEVGFTLVALALTIGSVLLWLYVLSVKWSRYVVFLAVLLTMSSLPALQGLFLEDLTLVVAAVTSAALAAVASKHYWVAAVLLAVATIKPQLVIFVLLWLSLWALAEWQSRKRLIVGFVISMVILLAAAEVLLPHWISYWIHAAHAYVGYVGPSLFDIAFGRTLALVAGAALVVSALGVFWQFRYALPGSPRFGFALLCATALPTLLAPGAPSYNQVMLVPALIWLCASAPIARFWRSGSHAPLALALACLGSQWLAALAVSLAFVLGNKIWLVHAPEILCFFFPLALLPAIVSAGSRLWSSPSPPQSA